ncbi:MULTISPECIES: AAA family ATPase [Mesorhizobium]|uniref:AAA family ATPase n=1 Tax=Mesorhizobium TaxID=68287 RepID=UPI0010A975D0|nr:MULTISPECIES: AAA family ATPase [Mesorhizobium]
MEDINIILDGDVSYPGNSPIVVLGPNGSGKTKLAQRISQLNSVSAISAQRRTWLDDNIPVQQEAQAYSNINQHQNSWQGHAYRPTEEINDLLSFLIQEHANALTKQNAEAILRKKRLPPITNTKLMQLQAIWKTIYPKRDLQIGGYFPAVKRLDAAGEPPYKLRDMSDGERTVLYMCARVLSAKQNIILIDEPELHLHTRLAVMFWDEIEKLRSDCRFIYITHDLNFALSRRDAIMLVAKGNNEAVTLLTEDLPSSVAADVLGAATLPFHARRIFIFEGQDGRGFAGEFFPVWFDDSSTYSMGVGDRASVMETTSGLLKAGVAAATVVGLVDRDYYPDEALAKPPKGVAVLALHEIESVLCDKDCVSAIASHLGKDGAEVWSGFHKRVVNEFSAGQLSHIVANRVRARVGDLLHGAFDAAQVTKSLAETSENHRNGFEALDLPNKVQTMFQEEGERVKAALKPDSQETLAILPGKQLLSLLASTLGFNKNSELTGLVLRALNRGPTREQSVAKLGGEISVALAKYLPPRKTPE